MGYGIASAPVAAQWLPLPQFRWLVVKPSKYGVFPVSMETMWSGNLVLTEHPSAGVPPVSNKISMSIHSGTCGGVPFRFVRVRVGFRQAIKIAAHSTTKQGMAGTANLA